MPSDTSVGDDRREAPAVGAGWLVALEHRGQGARLVPWQTGHGPLRPLPLHASQATLPGVGFLLHTEQMNIQPAPPQGTHGLVTVSVTLPDPLQAAHCRQPPDHV